MTPASFANAITEYADFIAQRNEQKLSHLETEEIRRACFGAFTSAEFRNGVVKIDGLDAVTWIKKYRNEFHVPLNVAKDEWDKRLADHKADSPR